jgi:Brp/Blh family beta-carotene 15,15'-monooxygenase
MLNQFQIKYLVYLLGIGFLIKIGQMLFPQLQSTLEIILLFTGLLFTGIPHGALDHYVAKKNAYNNNTTFNLIPFIIRYIILMMLYGIFWWLVPGLSLCFFIFLTAFHFGETDFHFFNFNNKPKAFIYGLSLTAWLLLSHQIELLKWIHLIIPKTDSIYILTHYLFKIPSILFLILCGFLSFPKKPLRIEWVLLQLVLLLANKLGLIGGFAFYFSGWHGWQAFNDIKKHIGSEKEFALLWKNAIPFTLMALFFLVLVFFVTPSSVWQMYGAPAFIVMISLLTLPHMVVMHPVYKKKVD